MTLWAPAVRAGLAGAVATVLTTTGGVWDFVVKPTLLTALRGALEDAGQLEDRHPDEAERPLLRLEGDGASCKVKADHSLQGRKVYVQRFTRFGQWVNMKRVILGRSSQKLFYLRLPRGTTRFGSSCRYNQVGAGYLDGFSRTVTVKRK